MPNPKSKTSKTWDNGDLQDNIKPANEVITSKLVEEFKSDLASKGLNKYVIGGFLNHQEGSGSLHASPGTIAPNFRSHQIKLDQEDDELEEENSKTSALGLSKECKNLINYLKKDQDTIANSLVFLILKQKELTLQIKEKQAFLLNNPTKENKPELEKEMNSLEDELSQLKSKIHHEKEKKNKEKEQIKQLELAEKNAFEEFKQGKVAGSEIEKITKEIDPIVLRLFFVQEYIGYATEKQKIIRRTQANNLSIIRRLLESNNNDRNETEFLLNLCNSLSQSTQDDLNYLIMQITNRNVQKTTEKKDQTFLTRKDTFLTELFFTNLSAKIKSHPTSIVDQKVIAERKREEQKEFLNILLVKSKAALNKQCWIKVGDDCVKELQNKAIRKSVDSSDNIKTTIIDKRFSLYCPLNIEPIIIRSINDILTYMVEGIKNIQSEARTKEALKNHKDTPASEQKKVKLNPIEQVAFIYREAKLGRRDLMTYIDKCLDASSTFDNFIGQYQHYFQRVEKYRKEYGSTEKDELKIEYIDLNKIYIPRFIFHHNENGLEILKKLKNLGSEMVI